MYPTDLGWEPRLAANAEILERIQSLEEEIEKSMNETKANNKAKLNGGP